MTATDTTVLEAVLRRDRAVVVAALVAVITIAWIWIVLGAGTGMTAMEAIGSGMPGMTARGPSPLIVFDYCRRLCHIRSA